MPTIDIFGNQPSVVNPRKTFFYHPLVLSMAKLSLAVISNYSHVAELEDALILMGKCATAAGRAIVDCISRGDVRFRANTERFQGSVPLLPQLCPLSVPKGGGGMWGTF